MVVVLSLVVAVSMGAFDMLFQSEGRVRVRVKVDLMSGWSKQGKAVRALSGTKRV